MPGRTGPHRGHLVAVGVVGRASWWLQAAGAQRLGPRPGRADVVDVQVEVHLPLLRARGPLRPDVVRRVLHADDPFAVGHDAVPVAPPDGPCAIYRAAHAAAGRDRRGVDPDAQGSGRRCVRLWQDLAGSTGRRGTRRTPHRAGRAVPGHASNDAPIAAARATVGTATPSHRLDIARRRSAHRPLGMAYLRQCCRSDGRTATGATRAARRPAAEPCGCPALACRPALGRRPTAANSLTYSNV